MLEAHNVSKHSAASAVQDVSIQVFKGEILGIIGPNGAGRTTFFNRSTASSPPTRAVLLEGQDIAAGPMRSVTREWGGEGFGW